MLILGIDPGTATTGYGFVREHPNEPMFTVQQWLAEKKLDALPVVEDEQFLGLITNRDINELYRLASSQADLISTPRPG